MTIIKFASIFSDRLNLNGDQANLFVLQQRLKWAGFASEIVNITSAQQLRSTEVDLILLGHGSLAAWASCEAQWPDLAADFISATAATAGLAIGSGATRVAKANGAHIAFLEQPTSEFVTEIFDGQEILGYKFADVAPNSTTKIGNAIVTWLHGPLLAKNPAMADGLIRSIFKARKAVANLDHFENASRNENTRRIEELVAGVWQLEKPKN